LKGVEDSTLPTSAPVDFRTYDKTRYFPALDGLRALCVLLVMFNHVRLPVPSAIIGTLGVDIFFVLSGFLITTLMLRETERTGTVSLKGFYTRRFFRIIPVYLATIVLYFIAVHATHDAVKTAQFDAALPWLLTFFQEYRPDTGNNILGHAWTLGIEEKFYVFWPLLLIILYPFRPRAMLSLAALFLAVLLLPHLYARSYGGLLVGAALAIALSSRARWNWLMPLLAVPDGCLCLLVLATYALCCLDYRLVLWFAVAVAWLIASLVRRTGLVRTLLESRILVYIGKRSYAIYLIHVLVLDSVSRLSVSVLPANAFVLVMIAYVGSVAFASLMHVLIEQPCINWGKRMSARIVANA
jgi:peptidoglycan/LPS O-acetylase OafA/YrhL